MKILILDCCHAGAGLSGLIRQEHVSQSALDGRAGLHGSYGIASASEGLATLLPANERRTVFSKAFCEVLTYGIENYEYLISVDSLFREVRKKIEDANLGFELGRPLRVSSIDDEQIAVCINRAVEPKRKPGKALEALARRVGRHVEEIDKLNAVVLQRKRDTDLKFKEVEKRVIESSAFKSLRRRQRNVTVLAIIALFSALFAIFVLYFPDQLPPVNRLES